MASVYILYSKTLDNYYTGSCDNLVVRLQQHVDKKYNEAYTQRASDWSLYLSMENLDYLQARKIERHIKSMKSRKYIENLKRYPEMISKLIDRYAGSSR